MSEEIEKELKKIEKAANELGEHVDEFCHRLYPKYMEIDDAIYRIRALLKSESE
jgi:hypothetical protein